MSALGGKITKIRAKNIHTEAGISLIKKDLPKPVETEAVMSFRIIAWRKFYTKAVMLLIQQVFGAFCGIGVCAGFCLKVTMVGSASRPSCRFQ